MIDKATVSVGLVCLLAVIFPHDSEATSGVIAQYDPAFRVVNTVQYGLEIDGARIDMNVSEKSFANLVKYLKNMNIRYVYRILAVPGSKKLYLIEAVSSIENEEEFGLQLYLIMDRGNAFSTISRTMSVSDTNRYRATIYSGTNTSLILTEAGNEGSWGLRVFEIEDGVMFDCGGIDVAVPNDIWPTSPLPFAQVLEEKNGWQIQFSSDLIMHPGNMEEILLTRHKDETINFVVQNCRTWIVPGNETMKDL